MTPLERAQMAQYGYPFNCTVVDRARAVLDLSVYNALSKGLRRDALVPEIVGWLLASWDHCQLGRVEDVVDNDTVAGAARRLAAAGFVALDGETIRIPVRDRLGRGRELDIDYSVGKVKPQWP